MTKPDLKNFSAESVWIISAIICYLAVLLLVWQLGFIYLLPAVILLPILGYYAFQSLLKPFLILLPMLGATYLGNVVSLIPDGTVPLTLFQIFLFIAIIVYVMHLILFRKSSITILGFEMELLLIFTLISFSILYSPNRESAVLNLTRMIFLVIMVYLIVNILKERSQYYLVFGLLIGIALTLGMLSVHAALLDPVTTVMNIRAGGTRIFGRGAITVHDPNVFATLFFLPIACTTSIFFSRMSMAWRVSALLLTLVLLGGLASTYSRSSWVATAFLILMLVIYYRQYKILIFTFLATLAIILSMPELRGIAMMLFDRIQDIFSGVADDSSRIRVLLGRAAIHMIVDSRLMGIGFRGFPEKFTSYFNTKESIGVVEPHNIMYELLAELGIAGFALFLILAILIFQRASENLRRSKNEPDKVIATTLISTLAAFIVFYQFYGGALVSTNLWAIAGLITAQNYYLKDSQHRLSEHRTHSEFGHS